METRFSANHKVVYIDTEIQSTTPETYAMLNYTSVSIFGKGSAF